MNENEEIETTKIFLTQWCYYLVIVYIQKNEYHKQRIKEWRNTKSKRICVLIGESSLWDAAFWREALRKPFIVCAVVVDHVIFLHPLEPVLICCVQFLWQPSINGGGWIWVARRCPIRPYTSIGIKIPVRGNERSLSPVCLNQTTPCSPIISIPQARINSHWLILWERNTIALQVLEFSNGGAINREAETE